VYIVICDNTPEVICKLMEEEDDNHFMKILFVQAVGNSFHRRIADGKKDCW
jgi:hypothetical protein